MDEVSSRMGAPVIEKAVLRAKGALAIGWYKTVYGGALKLAGELKARKGFSLLIEPGGSVSIGRGVFFNNYCSINCRASVTIGDHCMFGEGVRIYDHNHRFGVRDAPIAEQGFTCAPVSIGNNCWIGSNVVILKGATVGDNCVVGAGCVVSGKIPPDSVCTASRTLQISPVKYRDE
jgi:acetyltransferase-like isoleucine patch superfamily enzyme